MAAKRPRALDREKFGFVGSALLAPRAPLEGERAMAKQAVSRKTPSTPPKAQKKVLSLARALPPAHDAIAMRAFELYLSRGAMDGSDVTDWMMAERELSATSSS
jgi:hypothetical protein